MIVTAEMVEIARYVLDAFQKEGAKIVTAESCTGGLVSALLTDIAGSSSVFDRGFVTYSNAAKQAQLGVSAATLAAHGAVSAETAGEMAVGALKHADATASVAITGIAGPGGGSAEKPVGLVYIAVANAEGVYVEELQFGDIGRDAVRAESAKTALEMLVAFGLDSDETEQD